MIIRLAAPLQYDSIVDGPGLRTVLWTQGCKHGCPGCHNANTHNFQGGFEATTEMIKSQLQSLSMQKGITFSGGDPFEQAAACADIAAFSRALGLDIWCYTGYTYEELVSSNRSDWALFLSYIDVLIDGPFLLLEKDLSLPFRGSKNQRMIDITASFLSNNPVLWRPTDEFWAC